MFAAEHLLDLARLNLALERVEGTCQVRDDVLTGPRPFEQDADVVDAGLEGVAQRRVLADPLTTPEGGLGLGLIVPEVRGGDARLEATQLFVETSFVKDSSACRRPA